MNRGAGATGLAALLLGATLPARLAFCDDATAPSPCVDALEQVMTLQDSRAVYKQLPNDKRDYLEDSDRPAELARIQKTVASSCSADASVRAKQQAAADRLHQQRSPDCAFERDKLTAMLNSGSRDPPDVIRDQRRLVADQCPEVPMSGVWLLQQLWARPPPQ